MWTLAKSLSHDSRSKNDPIKPLVYCTNMACSVKLIPRIRRSRSGDVRGGAKCDLAGLNAMYIIPKHFVTSLRVYGNKPNTRLMSFRLQRSLLNTLENS